MKNIIFTLVLTLGLVACNDNGNKATTSDSKVVETKKTDNTKTYSNVKGGSQVDWRASHLGGVQPRFGKIGLKSATISVNDGKVSNAKAVLDMTSFTVENFDDAESKGKLTGHLQSPDFFNVSAHPTSTFELTGTGNGSGSYNSTITGNLTIMGKTKSISFLGNVKVSNTEVSIKSEDFSVDRRDWGLTYNVEGSEGVPADYLIANDIGFSIDIIVAN